MQIKKDKQFKNKMVADSIVRYVFLVIAILSASTIIITAVFIFIKGISPFINNYRVTHNGTTRSYKVNFLTFISGTSWFNPPNNYGVGFIIINTLYVVLWAVLIAVPISVLTALFVTKIAPKPISVSVTYVIEILASIPSIIYGLFGMGVITRFVKWLSELFGYQSAGGLSMLAAALVLAIMIIPTITLLSITAINAVPDDQIHASLALGASPTQTNFKIVLRGAKSGIFSGIILGVGRALGEATAVSMVAGNAGSGPNFNPFGLTRTLTSTMLMGIKETTGLDYDIRFSVGLVLIVIILVSNAVLNLVKRKVAQ
ncbi:MAG: phosphate ABC transporter permease subunit PstC [Acholeplasmataceae bacterium]|jgi:phosphate transport system permease protein